MQEIFLQNEFHDLNPDPAQTKTQICEELLQSQRVDISSINSVDVLNENIEKPLALEQL